ncbi:Transcription termination factor 2 [Orchesella cincta]|uniref:Transcription termination factor 2 n=1 Tax=Orchesella cincta TaxID=48709 RepID=A0A1D2MPT9_ORCCI|nr:Transcription termination factor 2 [Orchesella cincta]
MGGRVRKIPPKTVEIIEIELTEAEQAVYGHLMLFAQGMFQNFMQGRMNQRNDWERRNPPSDIRFSHLFALICRLRQCAVLPYLIETMLEDEEVDENESFDEFKEEHLVSKINPIFGRLYESSKIKRILEDLEELRDTAKEEEIFMDKVVIVSSWTKLLGVLYEHLKFRKFSSVYITGDLNIAERQDAMEKFNTRPSKPQIMLLSLAAGGVGLNLIGGNHVFFVEPHWNPQLELQAQDRVHRFGQEKNVFIRRYISQDTIEQRVLELQDMKLDLAEGVLNNTKKSSNGGLTIQQMKLLFQA